MSNANLSGTYIYWSSFEQANFAGANLSQIKSACNWEQAIYIFAPKANSFTSKITEADRQNSREYIENLKQEKASDSQKQINCDRYQ